MPNSTHGRMKAGRGVVVLAGFLAFAAIAFLTWKVAQEIRAQGSAASDNVQWSLSQSEVEFQEFYGRLRIGSDLAGIRRRFDVFYSRIETVSEAKVFADLREDQDFAERLANVRKFLEQTVEMIDGDDIALTSNIPTLTILSQNIRSEVRGLSNAGLKMFAERADLQRNTVARTLTQLAIALISLISALGLGVAFLVRLNRQVSERERQQVLSATRMNTIMNTSLDGVIVTNQVVNSSTSAIKRDNNLGYASTPAATTVSVLCATSIRSVDATGSGSPTPDRTARKASFVSGLVRTPSMP